MSVSKDKHMKNNYVVPESEEISVQVENNIMSGAGGIVDPSHGEEE